MLSMYTVSQGMRIVSVSQVPRTVLSEEMMDGWMALVATVVSQAKY